MRQKHVRDITMVTCQKDPTYAWQIGPFWQDTLDKDDEYPRHVWESTVKNCECGCAKDDCRIPDVDAPWMIANAQNLKTHQQIWRKKSSQSWIRGVVEEVLVGVIFSTLLDSNEGNLSPHTSQSCPSTCHIYVICREIKVYFPRCPSNHIRPVKRAST